MGTSSSVSHGGPGTAAAAHLADRPGTSCVGGRGVDVFSDWDETVWPGANSQDAMVSPGAAGLSGSPVFPQSGQGGGIPTPRVLSVKPPIPSHVSPPPLVKSPRKSTSSDAAGRFAAAFATAAAADSGASGRRIHLCEMQGRVSWGGAHSGALKT